jgi:hypothetical protein
MSLLPVVETTWSTVPRRSPSPAMDASSVRSTDSILMPGSGVCAGQGVLVATAGDEAGARVAAARTTARAIPLPRPTTSTV